MVEIVYFVHGTTTDNLEKKSTGWLPGVLSEKGVEQSKNLHELIKNEHFDIVFCSDLQRAIDSANINFARMGVEIIQDSRIRECNYGDLDGKDSSLVKYGEHVTEKFPNGEALVDVEKRMRDFVDFLKKNYDGKRVAMVCHRAPQLALDVITNGMTWSQALENDWRLTHSWQPGWKYEIR